MEIVDFIPVCGSMEYRKSRRYHKLKKDKNISDVAMKRVEVVQAQPKIIRFSVNLWKRLRDAYVHGMLSLAVHVVHFNNGEICFLKKIHDGDDDHDVLYLKAS